MAKWLSGALGLKGRPKKDKKTRTVQIGNVQGKKRSALLELASNQPASLLASENSLPMSEIVYFENNELQIDRAAVLDMVDRPPPSDRYNPSIARREVNKQDTQARYKSWKKAYRELKKVHPGRSDNWCALQIARMPNGKGFSSETIRKNMKK